MEEIKTGEHHEHKPEPDKIIKQRQEKIISYLKNKYAYLSYLALALIVWIAVKIRTLPMKINPNTGNPGLWDVTTNNWTLGPDLDPFLFLRWAKEIVAKGFLEAVDYMRYVPLGFRTNEEVLLHPYLIVWFHKIMSFLGFSSSVTYSAILYPVIIFCIDSYRILPSHKKDPY